MSEPPDSTIELRSHSPLWAWQFRIERAYADLKRQLVRQFPTDIRADQDAKLPFVQRGVQMAIAEWRDHVSQSVHSKV